MTGATGNGGGRGANRLKLAIWGTAALLLLVPLVAMQFTDEVAWGPADFVVFGAMLAAACGAYELATHLSGSRRYRAGVGVAVLATFVLVWVNLAVGVIGDEGNPANLMFGGVLLVGILGALVARFEAGGMAQALVATAIAQALVALIILYAGWGKEALAFSALFIAPWLASAWLFREAAREATPGAA